MLVILVGNVRTRKSDWRRARMKAGRIAVIPDELVGQYGNGIELQTAIEQDIKAGLESGFTVIYDGRNPSKGSRTLFAEIASRLGKSVVVINFGLGSIEQLEEAILMWPETPEKNWRQAYTEFIEAYEAPSASDKFIDKVYSYKYPFNLEAN